MKPTNASNTTNWKQCWRYAKWSAADAKPCWPISAMILNQGCGNCDTCLEPVETWDGTLAAQQALSAIYRTGQRFGVTYLINVLLGKADERIKQYRP